MNIVDFIIGVAVGAVAVAAIVVLIKQFSSGSLVELRRDGNGNIVEILEHTV